MQEKNHVFSHPQLGAIVEDAVDFLNHSPELRLPPEKKFKGAGVYALYYSGQHELYSGILPLDSPQERHPIYVGKAVPKGWRQGRELQDAGTPLRSRLSQHAKSIILGEGLEIDDFSCRILILRNEMLPLIAALESHFINRYQPIWNSCIDGFGNHDPGSGRYNQLNSEWDTIHPGRPWGPKMPPNPLSAEDIIIKGRGHLDESLT